MSGKGGAGFDVGFGGIFAGLVEDLSVRNEGKGEVEVARPNDARIGNDESFSADEGGEVLDRAGTSEDGLGG